MHFSPQGPWKASFAIDHPHTPSTERAWRKSKIMSVLHPVSCLVSDWAVKADFNAQRSKIAFFPLNYIHVPSSTCFTAEVKKQCISTMITAALFLLQMQPWSFALSTNSSFSCLLTLRISSCLPPPAVTFLLTCMLKGFSIRHYLCCFEVLKENFTDLQHTLYNVWGHVPALP